MAAMYINSIYVFANKHSVVYEVIITIKHSSAAGNHDSMSGSTSAKETAIDGSTIGEGSHG